MIQAAIFDMDGLMINTEPLQSQAYEHVLKSYGKTPQYYPSGVVQKIGVKEKDNWELMKSIYSINEPTDLLIAKRKPVYFQLLQEHVAPQPGLFALLQTLNEHKIPMAVASSSLRYSILLVLKKLNIQHYFGAIVSGEDVTYGKPAPDIFLKASEELKVLPQNCVVFEDAQSGIEAGKAAGMKVIAVPNEFTRDHDFSKADSIVNSLEKITWPMVDNLIGKTQ